MIFEGKFLENFFLELITATLKIAEVSGIVHEESPVYSKEALISDIGGALGLVLGLNLLDFLICSGIFFKEMVNRL